MRKRSITYFTPLLLIYILVFTSTMAVPATVSSDDSDIITALLELSDTISNLPDEAFEDPSAAGNKRKTLCNKIDAVINKVEAGAYGGAVSKLENDLKKTIINWIVDPWKTDLLKKIDEITKLIPPVHDIAVTSVAVNATHVVQGQAVKVTVVIENLGDYTESFTVTAYYDGNAVAPAQPVTDLATKESKTLKFIWDTTGVAEATYIISAEASAVEGESNIANNKLDDGQVKVTVPKAPVASFSYSPPSPVVGDTVSFDASASYDPDGGTITKYEWNFGDGTPIVTETDPLIDYVYASAGTYAVSLTVTDDERQRDTTTYPITIGKLSSSITINVDPSSLTLGESTTLSGSIIPIRADVTVTIRYRLTGEAWAILTTVTTNDASQYSYVWKPSEAGTYELKSSWEGDENTLPTESNIITATVTALKEPPVASFTYSPLSPVVGETVNFDASASYDPDGGLITQYKWDFGDGTPVVTESDPLITHAFTTAGTYIVDLTVTDDDMQTATTTQSITISKLSSSITINADPTTVKVGTSTTISGFITPTRLGVTVTIWYRLTGETAWNTLTTTTTDSTSKYSYIWTPTTVGTYELKSSWEGDENTLPAESPIITVEVIPLAVHDIAITDVVASPSDVAPGDSVGIDVSLENQGTEEETFDVIVKYDTTVIDTHSVTLAAGATTTESFTWDTSGVAEGMYTISAEASEVPDETDTTDNTYVDGTVNVTLLEAPVASFTWSPPEPVVGEEVTFTSNSTDPDGTIDSWEWDFNGDDVIDATTENATWTYDAAGTYTVTLNVTDNDSLTNSTSADITVSPAPEPPVASFTYEPTDPFLNQNVTFNASASTPDGGDILSYEWDFGDGTTDTSMNVTHAYLAYGNFTVTLNVTDSEGLWDVATDAVRVYPRPPIANFTFSPLTPYTNETVTFNATGSYDPDGDIVWYYWSFGDDTYLNATDQIANHMYVDDGTYTVTLVVSDNEGLNSTVSAVVTVLNRPLVAIFTESAETVYTGEVIYFNASASYNPDGVIVSYFWDFGDGNNGTGVTVDHAYADDGVYTVTLTVTDDDSETTSKSATKTVSNRQPIALFTENATTVLTGEIIHFDASGSNDLDGSVISYFWDFGDGSDATGVTVNHAYEDDGVYTVTLTVTDDDGETASKSAVKTVSNRPPIALFTENATTVDIDELIRFDASGSYDPDGSILNYFWDFGDGTNATMCVLLDHAYTEDGNCTVTLTVTDDDGASSLVSATITVKTSAGWPLFLIAGISLGIAALTGTAIYAIFRRKKKTKEQTLTLTEEVKEQPATPIPTKEVKEATDLEKICAGDRESYEALHKSMLLDPGKLNVSMKDSVEKAESFEKQGNTLEARMWYEVAGGLAIYEGDVAKVKEYFGKCKELSPSRAYPILEIPEKAVSKAQEYYQKYLKEKTL